MGVMQAIVDARPSRRAMLNIANTTWLQAIVPFFSELSIMFPMVYGPCFSECWLGLPFTWGPAKIYCSMAANEIPAPTFWVAVFLPELPVYTAISHALPKLLKLALPQFLWIPVINVEIAEWISMIYIFIESQIPTSMMNLWEQYEIWPIVGHYFEPFILRSFDIFRCSTDCIFLASLVYVATFGYVCTKY